MTTGCALLVVGAADGTADVTEVSASGAPAVIVSRVLIVLKAMMPATATMCKTSTMSRARDNFIFGSDICS